MYHRHIRVYEAPDYEELKKMDTKTILLNLITARNNLPISRYDGSKTYEGDDKDFLSFGMRMAIEKAIEAYKIKLETEEAGNAKS